MAENDGIRDGSASVFQGRIIVTDESGGQRAVIAPGVGIKVYVNGKEITTAEEVTSKDNIEYELMSIPGQAQVQVVVSPDGLKAEGRLDLVPGKEYELMDCAPRQHLVLRTEEKSVPPQVKSELIERALREHGVYVGIDHEAIESMVEQLPATAQVIARGRPPTAGEDARIELMFEDQGQTLPGLEESRVDWRELTVIPTVEAGDELALKHPLVLGQPGLTVTGEPIPAKVPADIELKVGAGAEIVEDGLKAVASRSGRPVYAKGKLEVYPLLVAEQGVNLASGNIKFDGDVVVKGNVEETMAVYAGGNIEVAGNVTHANLTAGGQVLVRQNVIGGVVRCGGIGVIHIRMQDSWEKLAQGLEDCATALSQISDHPQLKVAADRQGWGRIMSRLLDTKFTQLPALTTELAGAYQEVSNIIGAEMEETLTEFQQALSRRGVLKITAVDQVWNLARRAKRIVDKIKSSSRAEVSFRAGYAQGARVEASGDITISGKGCYQSFLYAGHTVRVDGQPGIIRGGVVQARTRIIANEVGSSRGSPTLLKVDAKGTVIAKKVHPNVTIQIGKSQHKFQEGDQGVEARIDKEGMLALY